MKHSRPSPEFARELPLREPVPAAPIWAKNLASGEGPGSCMAPPPSRSRGPRPGLDRFYNRRLERPVIVGCAEPPPRARPPARAAACSSRNRSSLVCPAACPRDSNSATPGSHFACTGATTTVADACLLSSGASGAPQPRSDHRADPRAAAAARVADPAAGSAPSGARASASISRRRT